MCRKQHSGVGLFSGILRWVSDVASASALMSAYSWPECSHAVSNRKACSMFVGGCAATTNRLRSLLLCCCSLLHTHTNTLVQEEEAEQMMAPEDFVGEEERLRQEREAADKAEAAEVSGMSVRVCAGRASATALTESRWLAVCFMPAPVDLDACCTTAVAVPAPTRLR